jgi:hypothetical protein
VLLGQLVAQLACGGLFSFREGSGVLKLQDPVSQPVPVDQLAEIGVGQLLGFWGEVVTGHHHGPVALVLPSASHSIRDGSSAHRA